MILNPKYRPEPYTAALRGHDSVIMHLLSVGQRTQNGGQQANVAD